MLALYNAKIVDKDLLTTGSVICHNGKILKVCENINDIESIKIECQKLIDELNLREEEKGGNEHCEIAQSEISHDTSSQESMLHESSSHEKLNLDKIEFIDVEKKTLMPAFIDMHVHFRDPGLTHKEDLESGLNAAKNGGYGTVVLMPNTKPVVSSLEMAKEIVERAKKIGKSNVIQTVSITKDFDGETTDHLNELNAQDVPVITEDGFDVDSSIVMSRAMGIAAQKGIIVSCHCENPSYTNEAKKSRQKALDIMKENNITANGALYKNANFPSDVISNIEYHLKSANQMLEWAEDNYSYRNYLHAKNTNAHIHFAHVSTEYAAGLVRKAKQERVKCSAEVTPHHLALSGEKFPEILSLVNPPLRKEQDRYALIRGVTEGFIDTISTDHAPHTAEDKANGAPGFTGLETAFGVCYTTLVKAEFIGIRRLSSLMSYNAAKLLKLNKGLIKEGYDADIVIVDEKENWIVDSSEFQSKGKFTPFEGMSLTGKVKSLIVNGKFV